VVTISDSRSMKSLAQRSAAEVRCRVQHLRLSVTALNYRGIILTIARVIQRPDSRELQRQTFTLGTAYQRGRFRSVRICS